MDLSKRFIVFLFFVGIFTAREASPGTVLQQRVVDGFVDWAKSHKASIVLSTCAVGVAGWYFWKKRLQLQGRERLLRGIRQPEGVAQAIALNNHYGSTPTELANLPSYKGWIPHGCYSLLLHGPVDSGKSFLMCQMYYAMKKLNYATSYIDYSTISNYKQVISCVENLVATASQKQSKFGILFLDNVRKIGDYQSNYDFVKSKATFNSVRVLLVIGGREASSVGIDQEIAIKYPDVLQRKEFIKSSLLKGDYDISQIDDALLCTVARKTKNISNKAIEKLIHKAPVSGTYNIGEKSKIPILANYNSRIKPNNLVNDLLQHIYNVYNGSPMKYRNRRFQYVRGEGWVPL